MPSYRIPEAQIELPRNSALLDTSVLVALADRDDDYHTNAQTIIEILDYNWLVVPSVLVEAWGQIVGKRRRWSVAFDFFTWLLTPGNVILLPDPHRPLREHFETARKYRIDLVDAQLMDFADMITHTLNAKPFTFIVTSDTRDFFKCKSEGSFRFSLYNMKNLEEVPFDR